MVSFIEYAHFGTGIQLFRPVFSCNLHSSCRVVSSNSDWNIKTSIWLFRIYVNILKTSWRHGYTFFCIILPLWGILKWISLTNGHPLCERNPLKNPSQWENNRGPDIWCSCDINVMILNASVFYGIFKTYLTFSSNSLQSPSTANSTSTSGKHLNCGLTDTKCQVAKAASWK